MIPLVSRQASLEDYPQFERFYADLGERAEVPSAAEFAGSIAPHAILLEEVSAGAVVGYAHFVADGGVGRVIHVAVDREWRGAGVGRALMAEIASRLRTQGCTRWELEVSPENAAAIRFFEATGLRTVATADAADRVRMEGDLPSPIIPE